MCYKVTITCDNQDCLYRSKNGSCLLTHIKLNIMGICISLKDKHWKVKK